MQTAQGSWAAYLDACRRTSATLCGALAQRFDDHILLQAEIHHTGACGAALFCDAYSAFRDGDIVRAFCAAFLAKEAFARALDGFARSEHGVWKGFYDNDCLTDVRLTVEYLKRLMGWLRTVGEGDDAHRWERSLLTPPEDRRVAMILFTERPLPDDVLARRLSVALRVSHRDGAEDSAEA